MLGLPVGFSPAVTPLASCTTGRKWRGQRLLEFAPMKEATEKGGLEAELELFPGDFEFSRGSR